jgi:hypothetical protein
MGQIGDIYEDDACFFLNRSALFSSLALVTTSARYTSIQLREQRNWRGHCMRESLRSGKVRYLERGSMRRMWQQGSSCLCMK